MSTNKVNPETAGLSKHTRSFGVALALASVVNGLLVVAKESSPAVQAGLQTLTGHHWTAHSAIILALFFLTGWGLGRVNGGQGIRLTPGKLLATVIAGVAVGGLTIIGFYLVGD
jgi:hypothetical protein